MANIAHHPTGYEYMAYAHIHQVHAKHAWGIVQSKQVIYIYIRLHQYGAGIKSSITNCWEHNFLLKAGPPTHPPTHTHTSDHTRYDLCCDHESEHNLEIIGTFYRAVQQSIMTSFLSIIGSALATDPFVATMSRYV